MRTLAFLSLCVLASSLTSAIRLTTTSAANSSAILSAGSIDLGYPQHHGDGTTTSNGEMYYTSQKGGAFGSRVLAVNTTSKTIKFTVAVPFYKRLTIGVTESGYLLITAYTFKYNGVTAVYHPETGALMNSFPFSLPQFGFRTTGDNITWIPSGGNYPLTRSVLTGNYSNLLPRSRGWWWCISSCQMVSQDIHPTAVMCANQSQTYSGLVMVDYTNQEVLWSMLNVTQHTYTYLHQNADFVFARVGYENSYVVALNKSHHHHIGGPVSTAPPAFILMANGTESVPSSWRMKYMLLTPSLPTAAEPGILGVVHGGGGIYYSSFNVSGIQNGGVAKVVKTVITSPSSMGQNIVLVKNNSSSLSGPMQRLVSWQFGFKMYSYPDADLLHDGEWEDACASQLIPLGHGTGLLLGVFPKQIVVRDVFTPNGTVVFQQNVTNPSGGVQVRSTLREIIVNNGKKLDIFEF